MSGKCILLFPITYFLFPMSFPPFPKNTNMNKTTAIMAMAGLAFALTANAKNDDDIKVNQVGYYPNEPKVAVIEPTVKQQTFALKDAKGKTVWKGKAVRKSVSPFSGKVRQVVDFSDVRKSGTYTLCAGSRKQKVVIRNGAFADVANKAMKAFYLQRTGMPIEKEYAGQESLCPSFCSHR